MSMMNEVEKFGLVKKELETQLSRKDMICHRLTQEKMGLEIEGDRLRRQLDVIKK